jgi:hypothetical protein
LEKLVLDRNETGEIDLNGFRDLDKLEELYFCENPLEKIDPEILQHMSKVVVQYNSGYDYSYLGGGSILTNDSEL